MKTIWIGGIHAVKQALLDNKVLKISVALNKKSKNLVLLLEEAKKRNVEIETMENYQIDMLLPSVKHQGVAAKCKLEQKANSWQEAIAGKDKPLILILDGIQDVHNLGACLRSALAAEIDAVLIPKHRAADITPVVHKVSCGASEVLNIFQVANLRQEIELMKEKGIWILAGIADHPASENLYKLNLKDLALAIVVGNEAEGIKKTIRDICDFPAVIPMGEMMESLNVSVAAAIMMFEVRRQRLYS